MSQAWTDALAAYEGPSARDPLVVVELELPGGGQGFAPLARLVAAGLGARLGLHVDRIEDLKRAIDAALRQPTSRDRLTLAMTPAQDDLEVEIGPLAAAAVDSHELEDVLSTLVDDIRMRRSGVDVWIAMRISRPDVVARR